LSAPERSNMARLNRGHETRKACRSNADRDSEQRTAASPVAGIINRDPGKRCWKREHESHACPIGAGDSYPPSAGRSTKEQPSVRVCLMKRRRPAPMREPHRHFMSTRSDRARRRLLTLAQAMGRTTKTKSAVMRASSKIRGRVERRFPPRGYYSGLPWPRRSPPIW